MTSNRLDNELLQQIATRSSASHRGLAVRVGVSASNVKYCLRALVDIVWVEANSFHRSDSKAVCKPGHVRDLRLRAGFVPWV